MLVVAVMIVMIVAMSMIVVSVMRSPVLVLGLARYVSRLIFPRANEIHRPVASVVLVTKLPPILRVPWRNV
jgi:hypothetical protein